MTTTEQATIPAAKLREMREAMGLSQEELGMAMGLAKGSGARLIRRAEADDIDLSPMAAQCVRYLYALWMGRDAVDAISRVMSPDLRSFDRYTEAALPEFMRK